MDVEFYTEVLKLEKARLEKNINQLLAGESLNYSETKQLEQEKPVFQSPVEAPVDYMILEQEKPCCSNSFQQPEQLIKLPVSSLTPVHVFQSPVGAPVGNMILEQNKLKDARIADLEQETALQKQQLAQFAEEKTALEKTIQEILSVNRQMKYRNQSLNETIDRLNRNIKNIQSDLDRSEAEKRQMNVTLGTLEMENANLSRLYEKAMEEYQRSQESKTTDNDRMRLEMWERVLQEREVLIARQKEDVEMKIHMLMKVRAENMNLLEQNGNLIKLSQCYQTLSSMQTINAGRLIPSLPALLQASSSSLGCEELLPISPQLLNLGRPPCVVMPLDNFAELTTRAGISDEQSSSTTPAAQEAARKEPVQKVAPLCEASVQTETASNANTAEQNIKEEQISSTARGREPQGET